jgi:hypothetical protein
VIIKNDCNQTRNFFSITKVFIIFIHFTYKLLHFLITGKDVKRDAVLVAYKEACSKHKVSPLQSIIYQLKVKLFSINLRIVNNERANGKSVFSIKNHNYNKLTK